MASFSALSRTTMKAQFCWLLPLGARIAASRIARIAWILLPRQPGMDQRLRAMRHAVSAQPSRFYLAQHGMRPRQQWVVIGDESSGEVLQRAGNTVVRHEPNAD